ncbi:MAG: hypothetical protein II978_01345 [Clostridia bacterium]|nr:hypothetical protein [Clostridia bacterium]
MSKLADSIAFLDNRKAFNIELKDGSAGVFTVALNFKTGLYYKILSVSYPPNISDDEYNDTVSECLAELLSTGGKRIAVQWVNDNITFDKQADFIVRVVNELLELLKNDCFVIPDLEVKKDFSKAKGNAAKKQREKAKEIERLTKRLKGKLDIYNIDNIALVSSKTSNSVSDILEMPILLFFDLVKSVSISQLREDEDWNLAYLRKMNKDINHDLLIDYVNDYKKNKAVGKPAAQKNKGAKLAGFIMEDE